MSGMESALDLSRRLNEMHARAGPESFKGNLAEILNNESIAYQSPRRLRDNELIGLGDCLEPGCEVRRLARDRALFSNRAGDEVPYNDLPCGNANTRLKFDFFDCRHLHGGQSLEPGSNCTFALILIGAWPPEIRHHTVAH